MTRNYFDLIADSDIFFPADYDEFPAWIAERHFAAVAVSDGYLFADYSDDSLRLTRSSRSGVIDAEVHFHAPDGNADELNAAAFQAVAEAWSNT